MGEFVKRVYYCRWTWLLLILIIKGTLFLFFQEQFQEHFPSKRVVNETFIIKGETQTFYKPIEHLAQGKGYSKWDPQRDGLEPSARRMPGLVPFYYPLYQTLGKTQGRTFLIYLQFLLGVLAVYATARTAEMLFRSFRVFVITALLFSVSSFVSIYHHMGLMESLSSSFTAFSLFFMIKGRWNHELPFGFYVLLAALFGTWSVFLRPATGLVFIPLGVLLLFYLNKHNVPLISLKTLKHGIILSLPLLITISLWSYRNYQAKGKFIPLEDSITESQPNVYPPERMAIRRLIKAWGGEYPHWIPGSVGSWFHSNTKDHSCLKDRMFSEGYDLDSLLKLRSFYQATRADSLTKKEKEKFAERTVVMAERFKEDYRNQRPIQFYLVSKLLIAKKFLFPHTINAYPFPSYQKMEPYHVAIKGGYVLLYHAVFLGGLIGIFLAVKRRKTEALLFGLFPLFYILAIVLTGRSETRYLVPLYPFWIVFCSYTLALLSSGSKGLGFFKTSGSSAPADRYLSHTGRS